MTSRMIMKEGMHLHVRENPAEAGSTVTGTIHLPKGAPLGTLIHLVFEGKEQTIVVRNTDDGPVDHKQEHSLIRLETQLKWEPIDDSCPFRVVLQNDLPSSMCFGSDQQKGSKCEIRYTLSAYVDKTKLSATRMILVQNNRTASMPRSKTLVAAVGPDTIMGVRSCCCGLWESTVPIHPLLLTTKEATIHPSQILPLQVKDPSEVLKRGKPIQVKLTERHSWTANGFTAGHERSWVLPYTTKPNEETNGAVRTPLQLDITYNGTLLQVQHELHLSVETISNGLLDAPQQLASSTAIPTTVVPVPIIERPNVPKQKQQQQQDKQDTSPQSASSTPIQTTDVADPSLQKQDIKKPQDPPAKHCDGDGD